MVGNKLKKAICTMAFIGVVGVNAYTVSAEEAHLYEFTLGSASQTAYTSAYTKTDDKPMVINCSSSTVAGGYFTANAQRYDGNEWRTMTTRTVYCNNDTYGFEARNGKDKDVRFKLEKAMSSTSVFKGKWATSSTVNVAP